MRAFGLLTFVTVLGCSLQTVSRETDDGGPSGLTIEDGGAADSEPTPPDALPPSPDLPAAGQDLAVPPGADLSAAPDLAQTPPGPAVLTHHNDNLRTGANLRETALTPANVNAAGFGKIFSRDVDGFIYAQPLVVSGITVAAKRRNVVYVATEHNSVYAFDADDPAASAPLWQVNLGTPVASSEYTCLDLVPEDGITSTPAIDPFSQTIYVSAKHKDNGVYAQTLHALDLATGAEKFGGPVDMQGSVPGSGWGSPDGLSVVFDPKFAFQRPALLLANGRIYAAFGGHCDKGNYHGWMMAYDAKTLTQTGIWNSTPDNGQGSIWMSGSGPAADADGSVYVITANGDTDVTTGRELSEAFVKLTPSLTTADWFIPYNYQNLNDLDIDLGSDGPLLVPNTNLIIAGGKEGVLYVVDRSNMGHYHAGSDSQILQSFKISLANVHGTPVYWQGLSQKYIYVWPEETQLLQFRFQGGVLDPNPAAKSVKPAPGGMPGGFLTISANGAQNGILWATLPLSQNANNMTVAGVVRAFDATDVSKELWNSEQNSARDSVGNFAKFNPPTVVNGKVYVGSFSGQLAVYGLLP
jgi:hypothetical protein